MATVRRYSADAKVYTGQEPTADIRDFRPDTSSAEALGVIGKAVGDFGDKLEEERKVKEELAKRKTQMQDKIGSVDASDLMENAKREADAEIISAPTEKHEAIYRKHIEKAMAAVSALPNITQETRDLISQKLAARADEITDNAKLVTLKKLDHEATT